MTQPVTVIRANGGQAS